MSKEILDEGIKYAKFRKPVNLIVDKKAWMNTCDELQGKAAKGTFIFIALSIVVAIFTFGILVFIAALGVGVFINVGIRKRFAHLKTLADHTFTISSDQIIDAYEDKKQIILFKEIQYVEFHNWGVELDIKKNRKKSDKDGDKGRILIPRDVSDYGRVLVTFEEVK